MEGEVSRWRRGNLLHCDIIVREFDLHSSYSFHFRRIGKV